MNVKYKVILDAEDGVYCQADEFSSYEDAMQYLLNIEDNYGEGQSLYIEEYAEWAGQKQTRTTYQSLK